MLKHLTIKNYAIIEEINIDFNKGLTIITGETGAGKSILMGALSLVLGERADLKMIVNPNEKCIIEGVFDISNNHQAKLFLLENELEDDAELIIRREINASGKSRVFVNDSPTSLSVVAQLSHFLIDLHRQFDTVELQNSFIQLNILDAISNHPNLLATYQVLYKELKTTVEEYEEIIANNKLIKQELDYNQFLYSELEAFQLQEDELENIETELTVLNNSESLKVTLQNALILLSESDRPIVSQLKQIIQSLEPFSSMIPYMREMINRLQYSLIELKDLSIECNEHYHNANYDLEKINALTEKLNEGNRLLKKHHVNSTQGLLDIKSNLLHKINQAVHADEAEIHLKNSIDAQLIKLEEVAYMLTQNRTSQIPIIERTVNELLQKVGMPNALMRIEHNQIEFSLYGKDKIEFQLDANKTGKYQPMSKVASGGELSRLMLCIKSMLASTTLLPTLVFDEIDTGISGESAKQVGQIMKQLATHHQLICITHLPQIASRGDQHLYIYKKENRTGTLSTYVKPLNQEERVEVLAEMLSGKDSTQQVKEMVKEMMM